MRSRAVISFYNTPSGMFSWWDQFPIQITQKLSAAGVDHIVYYKDYTEDSAYPRELQRVATNENLNDLGWIKEQVLSLCKEYSQVIVHSHSHYPPLKLWRLTYMHPCCEWHITEHRIASGRLSLPKRAMKILFRKLRLYPRRIIGVSKAVTRRNAASYGKSGLSTIYNGIDLDRYLRRERQVPTGTGPLKFLYVGRMDEGKGVFVLIEAFKLLKERKTPAQLTLVGGGKRLDELKSLSHSYGLDGQVHFAGYQHDVTPFYLNHHVIVIPSLVEEALSLVALESRAMGMPAIYSNKGGLPEVITDSGVMLEQTTAQGIADAVLQFTGDEGLYATLAGRCRTGIEKFSIEAMVEGYVQHYITTFESLPGSPAAVKTQAS